MVYPTGYSLPTRQALTVSTCSLIRAVSGTRWTVTTRAPSRGWALTDSRLTLRTWIWLKYRASVEYSGLWFARGSICAGRRQISCWNVWQARREVVRSHLRKMISTGYLFYVDDSASILIFYFSSCSVSLTCNFSLACDHCEIYYLYIMIWNVLIFVNIQKI